jgi:guanylate kinase
VEFGKANEETRSMVIFDHVVVNRDDQLGAAVDQIKAIVAAENCRTVQFK